MKAYILTLMASALIVTISSLILPSGNVKKYAHLVSSVMISLSVIAPFKVIFDAEELFDFSRIYISEFTEEGATEIYNENLKDEMKLTVEKSLSEYGRVYVKLNDDLSVYSIEIYTDENLSEETIKEIKDMYRPERLEVLYGE